MKCFDADLLLDTLSQGPLSEAQQKQLQAHLDACPACRFKHQVLMDSRSLDQESEVPAAFSSTWRQQIRQEATPVKQGKRLMKVVAVAAALLVMVGGTYLAGQDRRAKDSLAPQDSLYSDTGFAAGMGKGASPESTMAEMSPARSAMPMDKNASADGVQEKIIRTVRMELSTRQFEEDQERIKSAVLQEGGRVQESRMYNSSGNLRSLSLTLRVPSDKLDAVITSLKGVGRVLSFSESAQDITEQYSDTSMRLKTQQAKMERLQELLKKAENMEDLIAIENSISDTQYELDRLTGSLKGMDSRVDYATLDVTLNELSPLDTSKDQEESLAERIKNGMAAAFEGFRNLLSDFVVFLSVALPYLIALTVLILIIRLIVKRRKSK